MVQGTTTSRFLFKYPRSTARATRSALIPRTDDGRTVFASLPLMALALNSVRTYPGHTVITWMPEPLSSTLAALPKAFMANLVAL